MNREKLDIKAIKCWRIGRGITLAVATVLLVGMAVIGVVKNFTLTAQLIVLGCLGLFFVYALLAFIIYPNLEYRQWEYMITEDRVEITHGIFFIKKVVIPIIRIQNITVTQGPIRRKFGLYDIEISIASGNFDIPCLNKEVSDRISANLKDRIYTRLAQKEEK